CRVAVARFRAVNGEREDASVRLEDGRSAVRGSVIGYQELVVAIQLRHHLPDFPQNDADRLLLVVRGDADVDHVAVAACRFMKRPRALPAREPAPAWESRGDANGSRLTLSR